MLSAEHTYHYVLPVIQGCCVISTAVIRVETSAVMKPAKIKALFLKAVVDQRDCAAGMEAHLVPHSLPPVIKHTNIRF